MRQVDDVSLRPILLFNVAMLVLGPPLFLAVWRYRDGMAAWKRPMAIGSYLSICCVTVVELTDVTAIASYPGLAFALDMGAVVAGVAGIGFFWKSRTVRKRAADSAGTA
mgnify:CR=1 FL=1